MLKMKNRVWRTNEEKEIGPARARTGNLALVRQPTEINERMRRPDK